MNRLVASAPTCPVTCTPRARRNCLAVAALQHPSAGRTAHASENKSTQSVARRQALLGLLVGSVALGPMAPDRAIAKGKEGKEEKQPTIVNDPAVLKGQLEAQYQQWAAGQFDTWLAAQPETIKWQSTYNGVLMKFKGKAGARQYFTMLTADLDIKSYKPLAIFVDNDGDEATVVVEASGVSRRTQQAFKTIFLHMYTIGPLGQVIKFKEMTDAGVMAQLVPPPAAPTAVAPPASVSAAEAEAPVEPGSAARSA